MNQVNQPRKKKNLRKNKGEPTDQIQIRDKTNFFFFSSYLLLLLLVLNSPLLISTILRVTRCTAVVPHHGIWLPLNPSFIIHLIFPLILYDSDNNNTHLSHLLLTFLSVSNSRHSPFSQTHKPSLSISFLVLEKPQIS